MRQRLPRDEARAASDRVERASARIERRDAFGIGDINAKIARRTTGDNNLMASGQFRDDGFADRSVSSDDENPHSTAFDPGKAFKVALGSARAKQKRPRRDRRTGGVRL